MGRKQDDGHHWRFFRVAGVDQARIATGADIRAVPDLDQKVWAALACPVKGLEYDERTLALLDTDGDGRIRVPEIQAAVRWATSMLKDPDTLTRGTDALRLEWIDDSTAEGKTLLSTARHILAGLGLPDGESVSVDQAVESAEILAHALYNGDGIVPASSVQDEGLKTLVSEIVACSGGETDRCGEAGVGKATLDRFFEDAAAFVAWHAAGQADAANVFPLGDATAAAVAALQAVRPKIDDWYTRCRLAAFDARSTGAMNRLEDDWKVLGPQVLSAGMADIAAFPLAKVEPGAALPLGAGVNPAWADAMEAFRNTAVRPVLGARDSLTIEDWRKVCARLAPYEAWVAAKAGASVEPLGLPRVREILANDQRAALTTLIEADALLDPEMKAIREVERLARYLRDLHLLLNNFVSFTDFYGLRRKAVFQAGTLFLDGRAFELCLRVDDPGKHGALAGLSRNYLVYCDCSRPGEKMQVLAAVTNGDSDHLLVGRNGVFYDRKGRDWDATITKIVDNPISLRAAFWAPYKRFMRMIEEMVAKRAAAADAEANAKMAGAAQATATADQAKPAAPAAAVAPKKMDIGTVAAIGVAVGGITAAFGALLQAFFGLGFWMPLGILGIILAISGPSLLITWLKLRQRNLGPILDASGWAVNGRARINVPFGAALTKLARLPANAERSLDDAYADKKSPLTKIVLALVVLGLIAWGLHHYGYLGEWLGYGEKPPAAVTEPAVPPPAPAPAPAVPQ